MSEKLMKPVIQASSVYAFKNGYCLIVRQFEIPSNIDNKPLELFDLPSDPVHGTFSIQTTSNVKISSIRTKKICQSIEQKCTTIAELIQANMGGDIVHLLVQHLQPIPTWYEGKIEKNSSVDANHIILFETIDKEIIALPLSSIISIRGKFLKTTLSKETMKNCLSINYQTESNTIGQGLMKYLTFGIAWIPSYELDLIANVHSNVKILRLSLKCVVLNDLEDIQIENFSCIVGHPNLSKMINVIDPLLTTTTAKQFLKQLKLVENSSTALTTQKYVGNRFNVHMDTSNYELLTFDDDDHKQENNTNDDFYLYKFQQIRLEQNEKISLPIFDMQVPYRDVYHCQIDPKKQFNKEMKSEIDTTNLTITAEVWHSVEFDNQSGHTLTTAPVLITRDNQQFICQEDLNFTLRNNPVFIHLTKTPGIRVTHDEKPSETNQSAQESSVKIFEKDYIKEQWNGTITVANALQESVTVALKIQLHGNISDCSIPPKIDQLQQGDFSINQVHSLRWDVELESKQTKVVKYHRIFHRSIKPSEFEEFFGVNS